MKTYVDSMPNKTNKDEWREHCNNDFIFHIISGLRDGTQMICFTPFWVLLILPMTEPTAKHSFSDSNIPAGIQP
jgi:hypothetical protein